MTWFLALFACTNDPTAPDDVERDDVVEPEPEPEPMGASPSRIAFGPVTVIWEQAVAFDVRIEYRLPGGDWQSSPVYQGLAGLNRQSIIGIPTGTTADVRLVGPSDEVLENYTVTTPTLPASFPRARVDVSDESSWGPNGRYFLTSINENSCSWCTGRYWTYIADRDGTVFWAIRSRDNRQVLYTQVSTATGDHVLWDEVVWNSRSRGSLIHRTYLDQEIEIIPAPGHHHAFLELPDGTLVWGDKTSSEGEAITERLPSEKEARTIWTCRTDWVLGSCRSNSLYFDEATDRYWFSFYTQRAIVEVDRSSGRTNWSSLFEDGPEGDSVYSFDPPSSQFDWQHGVVFLENGNLLVSTDRVVPGSQGEEDEEDGEVTTVLAEYEIDRENRILREVWSFDPGYDARFNGETRRFANGNTLHVLGARSIAYEVERDGDIVWQIEYRDGQMLNRLEFLDDLWALMSPPPYNPRVDDEPPPSAP